MRKKENKRRRLPVGAEVIGDSVHFRVWAPKRKAVDVLIESTSGKSRAIENRHKLAREAGGYFAREIEGLTAGSRYRFALDGDGPFPDPASRYQPEGPHGASEVVDPDTYSWNDVDWPGIELTGQVIYEMHMGTYTREGTWQAAAAELPKLADLGVTIIEVMPVAEFGGRFGWGYDGVNLFAPTTLYGRPDDFRFFVDHAHNLGLGVILDVVYNHLGPDGNYLAEFAAEYFTDKHKCDWGAAINFDGPGSAAVREFFIANARYWISEFHLDGLRLDATQQIFDNSDPHIILELTRAVREAAGERGTIVVAENEEQDTRLLHSEAEGGFGLDLVWNDDFHHSAHVALTGKREAYYSNYLGTPQEFISAAKYGYLYQGQYYPWQKQGRGTPTTGIAPARFVNFIQNHDQVANSPTGDRIHKLTSPGLYRAFTTLLLLLPGTPMLLQGQEFAASSPFLYFADHKPDLAELVKRGRFDFLKQFPSIAGLSEDSLADPTDPKTFQRSKLDAGERSVNEKAWVLHRELLQLRRVFEFWSNSGIDGAVLGPEVFVLRYFETENAADRILVVNIGNEMRLKEPSEPLLAPLRNCVWHLICCSNDVRYGGNGAVPLQDAGWQIPAETAAVYSASPA
jgi:maltooligosyltrehalose trehalohydrolase